MTTSTIARRARRDPRSAAVMIPVFLVLTALVVDVGNWFSHSRQLQNRADAGALAAGVRARETLAAVHHRHDQRGRGHGRRQAVRRRSRRRDRREHRGRRPAEVQRRSSTRRATTPAPDNSDGDAVGPTAMRSVPAARPVANRRASPTSAPLGGTWVDVKVKEVDTESSVAVRHRPGAEPRTRARRAPGGDRDQRVHPDRDSRAVDREGANPLRQRVQRQRAGELGPEAARRRSQTVSGMSLWGPDHAGIGTRRRCRPGQMSMTTPATVPVPGTPAASDLRRQLTGSHADPRRASARRPARTSTCRTR